MIISDNLSNSRATDYCLRTISKHPSQNLKPDSGLRNPRRLQDSLYFGNTYGVVVDIDVNIVLVPQAEVWYVQE